MPAASRSPSKLGSYENDMIARMLAGGAPATGRPCSSRWSITGPRRWKSSSGTTPTGRRHSAVALPARRATPFSFCTTLRSTGRKVALFGRKINNAENQLAFVHFLRLIVEGQIGPSEAVGRPTMRFSDRLGSFGPNRSSTKTSR